MLYNAMDIDGFFGDHWWVYVNMVVNLWVAYKVGIS